MRLFLSVGDRVIDSVAVEPMRVKEDGYLHTLRSLLYIKNELALIALQAQPNYFIQVRSGTDPSACTAGDEG
jgi:N-dimethylarginine dimethylaminohydrolase